VIDLYIDYDVREIAALIAEDNEHERCLAADLAMVEFCDKQVEEAKARMFGYVARVREITTAKAPVDTVPYKAPPMVERAPEPIGAFMANLLTRYGVNPTGMTAIQGAVAYRNVPRHIKARVNAEMRKNRLDGKRASR